MPQKPASRPVTLLVNGRAREGEAQFARAGAALRAAGLAVAPRLVLSASHAEDLLRREVDAGAPLVVVGGGDGTLSGAAGVLAGTETALGVLPLGSGNTFARSVGVPRDLAGAARVIAAGSARAVDVGLVNGRVFLNSVALGVSADLARELSPEIKERLGLLAWPIVGARELWRHRALDLTLEHGGERRRLRTHQLSLVNGRYLAGPLLATPDASVRDRTLDVLAFGGAGLPSLLLNAVGWALAARRGWPGVRLFGARRVRVELPQGEAWLSADGEVLRVNALDISLWPGALRVMTPGGFDPERA